MPEISRHVNNPAHLVWFVCACAVCVCVVPVFVFVEFLRWPAVSARGVCVRSTWSAWLGSGTGSSLAARGWEGEHPWALKPPASASLQQLAVCTSALKGTEPQALIWVKWRPHLHS